MIDASTLLCMCRQSKAQSQGFPSLSFIGKVHLAIVGNLTRNVSNMTRYPENCQKISSGLTNVKWYQKSLIPWSLHICVCADFTA